MKRTILLLLCLALLLSGCSQTLPQDTELQTPTDITEESISLPPQPSESTQDTKPEEPVQTVYQVAVDYSQYAPKEDLSPLYSRLEADWIPDLKASDDYGHIYPFAGSAIYETWDMGYYVSDYLYGMIDESGRIIADATYIDISLLEKVNPDKSYYANDYLPMWVLERGTSPGEFSAHQSIYALATLDGSMVTDCKYSYVAGSGDYAIATEALSDGSRRFDLFDIQGNLICTSEDLPCLKESGLRPSYISYSDGMFQFMVRGENLTCSYYYTDLSGQSLLGPYSYGECFFDGYAVVELKNGHHAYINPQGEILNGMEFDFAQTFTNGLGIAYKLGYSGQVLFSASGKILVETAPGETLEESYKCNLRHVSGDTCTYYDQGNVLYGGPVPSHWEELGGGLFYADGEIINHNSGERYALKAPSLSSSIDHVYSYCNDGVPYLHVFWSGNHSYILSTDNDLILDSKNGLLGIVITDHLEDKAYLWESVGRSEALYGEDASVPPLTLPTGKSATLRVYNGRILYMDERCCAYYDLEGNLLFRYPLTSIYGD